MLNILENKCKKYHSSTMIEVNQSGMLLSWNLLVDGTYKEASEHFVFKLYH